MSEPREDRFTEPEDAELGEPIAALAGLTLEPAPGLVGRIRRSIRRRLFVSDVVDLSWTGPRHVLAEFLRLIFQLLNPGSGNGDRRHE